MFEYSKYGIRNANAGPVHESATNRKQKSEFKGMGQKGPGNNRFDATLVRFTPNRIIP
jgi:hypothetical protein